MGGRYPNFFFSFFSALRRLRCCFVFVSWRPLLQYARRPLLQLFHPNSSRYFSRDDLASLDLISLRQRTQMAKNSAEEEKDEQEDIVTEQSDASFQLSHSVLSCFITYHVAVGGCDGILLPTLSENLCELYQAIASVAAEPKPEESEKSSQHILEDFHSSRTIRRLVLDSPTFASILFKKALSGKCRSRILSAFLGTQDVQVREMAKEELQVLVDEVREMAKEELQVLVDEGALKITGTKKPE
ncbi:hypothetical protein F2Q69_00042042 [Brassica cretica]|uniref:CPL domain-containing protein n=1 Tax=Brassica cretica TaxID=69181 RepID=A0A8S9NGU9_BRACR|nr:hypothetical protein F2Q69_00042042 [Brassica cretica]